MLLSLSIVLNSDESERKHVQENAGCTACCSWYLAFSSGVASFHAAPSCLAISANGVSGLAAFSSARLLSQKNYTGSRRRQNLRDDGTEPQTEPKILLQAI